MSIRVREVKLHYLFFFSLFSCEYILYMCCIYVPIGKRYKSHFCIVSRRFTFEFTYGRLFFFLVSFLFLFLFSNPLFPSRFFSFLSFHSCIYPLLRFSFLCTFLLFFRIFSYTLFIGIAKFLKDTQLHSCEKN